jgi:Domain of unknown function (DUF4338)
MELTREQALHCSKIFHNYFSNTANIEQYMREEKIKSVANIPSSLFPPEDDLFSDFSMHPNDMDIEVCEIPNETWETLLAITSSHVNKAPVGRNIQLTVREKNSGKILGFIRLGSPVIYMKPRNDLLGQVWIQNPDTAKRFNHSTIMGFVIVPSQPFGFNYLGGKLLAAICTSHTVREIVNKKYDTNLCLFETTSLYGTTKGVSQYDGMKPYIRFKGLTDSDLIPMINGQTYIDLKEYVESKIGGDILGTDESTTSRKLRTFTKIVAMTKAALKGTSEGEAFLLTIENAKKLTEKKRYYVSDYGFKNAVDYINCKSDKLIPGENYKKHELANIVEWWRNKAINRYETLKSEGRLRTELEVWTSGKEIQIIR